MNKLHPHKTGLALGSFFGLVHIVWALTVSMGFAASYLSFIFGLHFLSMPFEVQAFSWGKALMLIIVASVMGYILGQIFAFLWNRFTR